MQSEKSTWPHSAFFDSVMTQDLTARPVLEKKTRKQKTLILGKITKGRFVLQVDPL